MISNGFIAFDIAAGKDRQPAGFGKAKWAAKDDENAVVFNASQEKDMTAIRDAVEEALVSRQT